VFELPPGALALRTSATGAAFTPDQQEGTDMAEFTVNPQRHDPYKSFKFRVKWDGKYIAGVSKISGLKRETEVVLHREGGDVSAERKSPGRTKYEAITLERGVTHDPEFENWANLVHVVQGDAAMSLKNFRKDILIELRNEQDAVVKVWKVYRCWVSAYDVIDGFDANDSCVALERITLENEGWERDLTVPEPQET
jgi:phage tail-like protein